MRGQLVKFVHFHSSKYFSLRCMYFINVSKLPCSLDSQSLLLYGWLSGWVFWGTGTGAARGGVGLDCDLGKEGIDCWTTELMLGTGLLRCIPKGATTQYKIYFANISERKPVTLTILTPCTSQSIITFTSSRLWPSTTQGGKVVIIIKVLRWLIRAPHHWMLHGETLNSRQVNGNTQNDMFCIILLVASLHRWSKRIAL